MIALLTEAFNFIAIPFVIAVIQCLLFIAILGKAGLPRWTAFFPFVPILAQVGIYYGGGWISFYEVLGPIPFSITLYPVVMALISFIPLFVIVFARWPAAVQR